jgi:hypothetical protein
MEYRRLSMLGFFRFAVRSRWQAGYARNRLEPYSSGKRIAAGSQFRSSLPVGSSF